MLTGDQINLLSQRYFIDPQWVHNLVERDFLLTYADVPLELHERLYRIQQNLKSDAWTLTQLLYPSATRDEYELIWIDGAFMCSLSEYWWQLIAAKADETEAMMKGWDSWSGK